VVRGSWFVVRSALGVIVAASRGRLQMQLPRFLPDWQWIGVFSAS